MSAVSHLAMIAAWPLPRQVEELTVSVPSGAVTIGEAVKIKGKAGQGRVVAVDGTVATLEWSHV